MRPASSPVAPPRAIPRILPGQSGYHEAVTGWNTSVEHHPKCVVLAASADDVRAAVRYAADHGLPVAVRATGHGSDVSADGAVLIATGGVNDIAIDPVAGTATVGAGVTSGELATAAARLGLAPLSGSSDHVGVVGYVTGGGLPVLGRSLGYAVDAVRSFDLVTADGRLRHVSPQTLPDLFWAVRGGRGNFGIVTSMTLELQPITQVYGGGLFFDGTKAEEVLGTYLEWLTTVPRAMSTAIALKRFPAAPAVPAAMRGRFLVHVRIAADGDPDLGRRLIRPLRALAPEIDTVTVRPYPELGQIYQDPRGPVRASVRSTLLANACESAANLTAAVIAAVGPDVSAPAGALELRHLGGALADVPTHPSCLGHRDADLQVFLAGGAPPPVADAVRAFQRDALGAVRPWDTGAVVPGFLTQYDTSAADVARAYEPTDYRRLTMIKAEHDRQNVFRSTHNVPPLED